MAPSHLAQEGLAAPEAVAAATADYREEMDTVGAFIAECCVLDLELEIPSKRLHDRYREWCNANGETPMSVRGFSARLGEKGFTSKRTKAARGWRGLGLVTQVTH